MHSYNVKNLYLHDRHTRRPSELGIHVDSSSNIGTDALMMDSVTGCWLDDYHTLCLIFFKSKPFTHHPEIMHHITSGQGLESSRPARQGLDGVSSSLLQEWPLLVALIWAIGLLAIVVGQETQLSPRSIPHP